MLFFDLRLMIEVWNMGLRHGIRKRFDEETGQRVFFEYFYNDDYVGEEEFENGDLVKQRIFEGDEKKFWSIKRRGW